MAHCRPSRGEQDVTDRWSCRARRFILAVAGALPIILLTSCATLGPDTTAAAGVATAFHRAIEDGNGNAACAVLAPATMQDLENTSGHSCIDAILDEDLPDAREVEATQAFGRGAQVLMDGDVVFLSVFGDHWLITAAGCTPRGDRPYDCTVKGG